MPKTLWYWKAIIRDKSAFIHRIVSSTPENCFHLSLVELATQNYVVFHDTVRISKLSFKKKCAATSLKHLEIDLRAETNRSKRSRLFCKTATGPFWPKLLTAGSPSRANQLPPTPWVVALHATEEEKKKKKVSWVKFTKERSVIENYSCTKFKWSNKENEDE